MAIEISKRKLLWVLSGAIDLVGVTDLSHGKRVAFIADAIREEYGDFPWSQDDVVTAGLLHDCGVSSTDLHEQLVKEFEYHKATDHCIRGALLLKEQDDYSHLSKAVGFHHTRWEYLKEGLDEFLGNLLFLADRVDVLAATAKNDILMEKDRIIKTIISYRGTLFSPELVDVFINVASRDIFWLNRGSCHNGEIMRSWLTEIPTKEVEYHSLFKPLKLFASCVDGKSFLYTYNHSIGVAALARKIAVLSGFTGEDLDKIELAGLMHDLGKLKIPDSILKNSGKLSDNETSIMRHHSFDTYCILSKISGMEEIGQWTLEHHEKINGKGYPSSSRKSAIPKEARILTIADIVQALAQDRPYREALSKLEIIKIINDMVDSHELDKEIVDIVNLNIDECMNAALLSWSDDEKKC